jgi:hypothetical protein
VATYRIPILDFANPSGGTAGAVFAEPYAVKATNDVWNRLVWIFTNTATRDGLHSGFMVPKNYAAGAKIVVVWTSTVTTGDVVWDCDYRTVSGDDANSLDQTSNEESVTVTDTAPGAAHRRLEASMTLTAGNFAPDDEVEFALFRDGAAAGDTLAGDVIVFELMFEYTDG